MATLQDIIQRAEALKEETALNSISPDRAGGIMYDTLIYINQMQLQESNPLLISKIYASVAAMEADSDPISDLTGRALVPGQVVVIATGDPDDPDEGVVYRYDGIEGGSSSWTAVGKIGNAEPVDTLDSDSTTLPLAARQGKVLDGKISQLGQDTYDFDSALPLTLNLVEDSVPVNADMTELDLKTITTDTNEIAPTDVTDAAIFYMPVKKGDVILISCPAVEALNARLAYGLFQTITDGSIADYCYHIKKADWQGKSFIFQAYKDGYFALYFSNKTYITGLSFTIRNLLPKGGSIPRRIDYVSYPGAGINATNGNTASNVNRRYTDYIDVSNIKKLLYTKYVTDSATTTWGMAFYDENKTFISGERGGVNGVGENHVDGYELSILDVPVTAKYARFTMWAKREFGDFFVINAERDAISREVIVPYISYISKNYSVDVPITADYVNLQDSPSTHVLIRANIYMPYNGGCAIEFKQKETTNYQYGIWASSIDSSHAPSDVTISDYVSGNNVFEVSGNYDYIYILTKNGNNDEVSIEGLLAAYDIIFHYKKEIPSLVLKDDERKWDFFGAFVQSTGRILLSDYLAIPKQFMKLRIDIPVWARVRFRYGLRDYVGWTGYYYSGDIVTFERNQSALLAELTLIDGRGLNVGIYERDSVGNQMSFTILDENDKDIFNRNFGAEKYLGAIRTTPGINGIDSPMDLPMIVHVSDIHGDAKRFNSAFDYADYLSARILINTGDNTFYLMSNGVMFHEKVVFAHKTDFANCLGNHDTYDSSLANIYNKNIAPFAEDYGYHKASGSDVTDKCYYYKDLTDWNLRIITLDIYDGIVTANYKARVSSTQFNWFISTLASTPAGYGVLVVMHQAPHTISPVTGKTDFNDSTMDPQINAIDSDYMQNAKITGNPFGKVIDAFIAKGTISGSYTQKNEALTADETVTYEADFTNLAEGVEFIAYLNGHTHRDFVGYVADCVHNQLNLNVCAIPPISQSTGYKTASDIMRDSSGANQDAFNVYTINRTDKTVGIARIGSNLSKDLRSRKVMFISYVDQVNL